MPSRRRRFRSSCRKQITRYLKGTHTEQRHKLRLSNKRYSVFKRRSSRYTQPLWTAPPLHTLQLQAARRKTIKH